MQISRLKVENFKRIVAIDISPDGGAVVVGGRNAQGKSSTLDAIAAALGGTRLCPGEPVRRGAESASVEVTTDDGMRVTRTWTADGKSTIKIENADGFKVPQPQTWLDARLGAMSFDPLAFSRLKPAEQADTLRKLCGVDTRAIEAEEVSVFATRTEVNRDGKALAARFDAMPHHPDAEPVDVSALLAEQSEAQQAAARKDRLATLSANSSSAAERVATGIAGKVAEAERAAGEIPQIEADAEAQIAEIRRRAGERQAAAKKRSDDAAAEAERLRTERAAALAEADRLRAESEAVAVPDLDAIRQRLAGAEGANAKVRANAEREAVGAKLTAERERSAALTAKLKELADRKAALLAEAKMPIPGLGMAGDGVTFGGLPLEQASGAERLRVAVAIGLAANPTMRVLLVREGALLDDDALAAMAAQAAEANAQVWIEVVGDRGGIVIEDGGVVS